MVKIFDISRREAKKLMRLANRNNIKYSVEHAPRAFMCTNEELEVAKND